MTMTQVNPATDNLSPKFDRKMFDLARAMQEFKEFYWIGIIFFWLIVPPIILFIKYIKYLVALYQVKENSINKNFNDGFVFLMISFIVGFITSGAAHDGWPSFVGIISVILTFVAYTKFEEWSLDLDNPAMKEGFHDIKVANLFLLIFIGIFMIPGAFEKTATAIYQQYATDSSEPSEMAEQQFVYTTQTQAASPQQTLIVISKDYPDSIEQDKVTETTRYCPFCGFKLPTTEAKFCTGCGNQIN
jgi:hypothetical protein